MTCTFTPACVSGYLRCWSLCADIEAVRAGGGWQVMRSGSGLSLFTASLGDAVSRLATDPEIQLALPEVEVDVSALVAGLPDGMRESIETPPAPSDSSLPVSSGDLKAFIVGRIDSAWPVAVRPAGVVVDVDVVAGPGGLPGLGWLVRVMIGMESEMVLPPITHVPHPGVAPRWFDDVVDRFVRGLVEGLPVRVDGSTVR